MENNYTIIEDVFANDNNQITAARGYLSKPHIPQDMIMTMLSLTEEMVSNNYSNS